MKHYYFAEFDNIRLRPLGVDDIELLRKWRNDKSQTTFLRNIGEISVEAQKKWFKSYLEDDSQIIFAIEETKELHRMVGSVALYEINKANRTAEIGKIQIGDSSAHGKGIGYKSFLLAMSIGFRYLSIREFHLDVHQQNIAALSIYVKAGFTICGSHDFAGGGKEIEMKIDKKRFDACNPDIKNLHMTNKYNK